MIFRELGIKGELALTCARSATNLSVMGALSPAAVALYGGQFQAASLNYSPRHGDKRLIDEVQARLAATVEEGTISAAELKQWQAEGEAMNLDELVQFTLDELEKLQENLGAATVS